MPADLRHAAGDGRWGDRRRLPGAREEQRGRRGRRERRDGRDGPGARDARDRKSTRLNSSHPSISYAVFCLKKKSICRTPAWDEAEPTTQALIERTASLLATAGARVSEVSFAAPFTAILDHHRRISSFDAAR